MGDLFPLPDSVELFRESGNMGGMLGLSLSDGSDIYFDCSVPSEGSAHTSNNFLVGEAQTLSTEQSDQTNIWGNVILSNEEPLGRAETTSILHQTEPQDHGFTTQLSRAGSAQMPNTDWENYLDFSPSMRSSPGALAATFNILDQSARQVSIIDGRTHPSPEIFATDNPIRSNGAPDGTFKVIDLETVAKPLMLVEEVFLASLSELSASPCSDISGDITEWVASEFRNLLATSYEASALAIRNSIQMSMTNEASWTPLSNKFLRPTKSQVSASSANESTGELHSRQPSNKASLLRRIPVGCLSIKLTVYGLQESSKVAIAAFTFTPALTISKKGFSAALLKTSSSVRSPKIARGIISFNVVPYKCPIVTAIKENNLKEIQQLFSSKQASPHDRLPNGTSLLSVS